MRWLRLRNRHALHLQIEHRIAMCRIGAGMPQPMTDTHQIYPCFQEMYGSTMAHAVRMQALSGEEWESVGSLCTVLGQDIPYPKTGQRLPTLIEKHRGCGVGSQGTFSAQGLEHRGGLR